MADLIDIADHYGLTHEEKERFLKELHKHQIVERMRANRLTLDDITAAAPNWICKNILAEGHMSMLAGEGGSGKSLFAISLAAKLTSWGKGVYYYSVETSSEGQVKAQFLAQNGVPELLTLDRDEEVSMADFVAFNEIMEDAGRDVMIIDHLFDYTPAGKDLNNAQDVVEVLKPLKSAVNNSDGKSVLIIHHLNKNGTVHGSAQITAQFRHVVKLMSIEGSQRKIAEVEKTNLGIRGVQLDCQIDELPLPGGTAGLMVWTTGSPAKNWHLPTTGENDE